MNISFRRVSLSKILFDSVSQLCASFELGYFLSRDSDSGLCCRVHTCSFASLCYRECSETNEGNFVTLFKSFRNCAYESVRAFLQSALLKPDSSAIALMRSALFIT